MTFIKKPRFNNQKRKSSGGSNRKVAPGFDLLKLIGSQEKETVAEIKEEKPLRKFSEMNLAPALAINLYDRGFESPTHIQNETFESILEGRDILGIANTGTGKTGAFLMPLIQQMLKGISCKTLVVVPTRELAQQVQKEFFLLSKNMNLFSSCFIGGTNISTDYKFLKKHNDIIIGTPGRLLDLVNRKALSLGKMDVLILDEFDRMLDMGFINDVKKIDELMKNRKQTLLFSATEDANQKSMVRNLVKNPVTVRVSTGQSASEQVNQKVVRVGNQDRTQLLIDLVMNDELKKVLVFAETKRQVDKIEKKLNKANISAGLIHGNKSQGQRTRALDSFKNNKIKVLVATDVAARGIDVADISHVINFQVPRTADSYIHRIGRTGRAGKYGTAITFID